MDVAADHDRVLHFRNRDVLQQPRATGGIAVPVVGPEAVAAPSGCSRAARPSARLAQSRSTGPATWRARQTATSPAPCRASSAPDRAAPGRSLGFEMTAAVIGRRRSRLGASGIAARRAPRTRIRSPKRSGHRRAYSARRAATGSAAPACARRRRDRRRRGAAGISPDHRRSRTDRRRNRSAPRDRPRSSAPALARAEAADRGRAWYCA